jgi:magnesium transporter
MPDTNKKLVSTGYPPETAGAKMTTDIPVVHPEETVGQVLALLREKMGQLETINYIYVTDKENKLVGVFSVKEIFQKPPETKVKDLIDEELVTVRARTDQERVAILALRHNLKAIPVVDKQGLLLGVVPSDIILEILYSETGEDMLRFAGAYKPDQSALSIQKDRIASLVKSRFPWLLVGLFGEGIIATYLIKTFETSVGAYLGLIAFVPVILYMGSAVGMQTQIIFVRNFAMDHLKIQLIKYFLKELRITFLMAVLSGVILATIGLVWQRSLFYGLIVGLALFCSMIFGSITGIFIPWLLTKFKQDPAIGSGPVGTVIRDISSLLVYFVIASALIHLL